MILAATRGPGATGVAQWRASQVLSVRRGVCEDYSVRAAALLRAAGFRGRVVEGDALLPGDETGSHAWDQVWVEGWWLTCEATWNAGYIRDGGFIPHLRHECFDSPEEVSTRTHRTHPAPRPVSP
jgi:transglutaminase-like putative cysteine protease